MMADHAPTSCLPWLACVRQPVCKVCYVCVHVCVHAYSKLCAQAGRCMFFLVFLCAHSHTSTRIRIPTLSINSRGAGQRCPLDGDSPVRLHLARTHQQGHKVNKRQPLNLVLPDRCNGPLLGKEERVHRFSSDTRRLLLLLLLEVQTRMPTCRNIKHKHTANCFIQCSGASQRVRVRALEKVTYTCTPTDRYRAHTHTQATQRLNYRELSPLQWGS